MADIQNTPLGLKSYLNRIGEPEHPVLQALRGHTQNHRLGKMALAREQAALLTWLARLIQAECYLEVGVFTGYSSTATALALPERARITACDVSATLTDIARETWRQAGVEHKIELYLQPVPLTLDGLIAQGLENTHDTVLTDTDRPSTPQYYERCLQLVRSGGIIAIDNAPLGGRVMKEAGRDRPPSIAVLQDFNRRLPLDGRIVPITLPVGDRLILLLKKQTDITHMNIKTNIVLLFPVFVSSTCVAVSNGDESSSRKGVPYPVLNEQTQIDQLGVQVARFERSVNLLQTCTRQLERQGKGAGQRISSSKLKNDYLAKNDVAQTVADTDANETRLYDQVFKYYRSGNYTAAAAVLKGTDGGNGSEISYKDMYLPLQSQQRLDNYESVINIGGRYANRFRNTAQTLDVMYSIGQCQYKLQQKDIARDTRHELIHTYPDSEAVKWAAASIRQR